MNNNLKQNKMEGKITIQIEDESIPMLMSLLIKEQKAAEELVNDKKFANDFPALTRRAKQTNAWLKEIIEQLEAHL